MNYELLFAAAGASAVRVGLVGAGEFGRSFVAQALAAPGLDVVAVADTDVERARATYRSAGVDDAAVAVCDGVAAAAASLERGRRVVVPDGRLLVELAVDVVVEATGNPEAGAAVAAAAIEHGRHVAMVSKEAESVVGPELAARAAAAGVVYTLVDGDQPSLLVGLVSWARALGLEVVSAGKSSEYDFVLDPTTEIVRWRGRAVPAPGLAKLWHLAPDAVAATVAARGALLAELPQRTVPDLCEMGIVTNATGLGPDTPAFHVPVARAVEVPEVLRPRADGGILERAGVVDVFNCLRRPDEASFAGGVFVVVACTDRATWRVLAEKGIPVSRDGAHGLLYNPQHLLGVEAPMSVLAACRLGQPTGARAPRPLVDLVARAARHWRRGEVLAVTDHHHHEVAGLDPELVDGVAVGERGPLPYYMAVDRRLTRDLAPGELVTRDAVEAPDDSVLWALRAAQDERFHG
ncbi:MAG: flagellar biosynthesis protein FlgA [Ectothiorhodospiraceae bacterium]|nr:flagellar biosynthesis protein FlgA [Chromatiales bacterium]MCP5156448.1 flagellar biosynthesis protein FlgA [Ectothiorhodospiraceae bacterium]